MSYCKQGQILIRYEALLARRDKEFLYQCIRLNLH